MKQAEESVSRSTYETLLIPALQDRKLYRLRAFGGSAHRGLLLYRNKLICQAKLAILTAFEEDPDKPFVATKIHSKILATNCTGARCRRVAGAHQFEDTVVLLPT